MTGGRPAYDVAIIGGGTAGCILAARLSEDPGRRVVLIEAGPDPRPTPDIVRDPARQGELVGSSEYVRRYPVTRPDGSTFTLLSGRILGGGSAVNNMAATRPMAGDFTAWSAVAGDAWSYQRMLPLLRALEHDLDFGDAEHHGRDGPVTIEHPITLDDGGPAVEALLAAAAELGLPRCDDINVPLPLGVCGPAYTTLDGHRVSTASAYLEPARKRPNLTVLADTIVRRIVGRGANATGVEVRGDGRVEVVPAHAVVVSAGVYHSPQVLMLSGVGPAAGSKRIGVPIWWPLEGVGAGLSDHAVVPIEFGAGTDPVAATLPKLRIVARSSAERDLPNLHVFVRPPRRRAGGAATMPVSIHLLEQRVRGTVTLRSADPLDMPIIDPRLAEHPDDIGALVDGIGLAERLTDQLSLRGLYGPLLRPAGPESREAHVRASFESYHHGVGTCRVGAADDPAAVVGPDLRLRGFDNVWVADASVLPSVPHANPNLATMVVAEFAARQFDARPV
jgi:choline dehydrogenase